MAGGKASGRGEAARIASARRNTFFLFLAVTMYVTVQSSTREDSVEPNEESGASAVAVAGWSSDRYARRVLPVLGLSAKGERAIPGVGSGASSRNIHSFITD